MDPAWEVSRLQRQMKRMERQLRGLEQERRGAPGAPSYVRQPSQGAAAAAAAVAVSAEDAGAVVWPVTALRADGEVRHDAAGGYIESYDSLMARQRIRRSRAEQEKQERREKHLDELVTQFKPMLDEELRKIRYQAPGSASQASRKRLVRLRKENFARRINLELERRIAEEEDRASRGGGGDVKAGAASAPAAVSEGDGSSSPSASSSLRRQPVLDAPYKEAQAMFRSTWAPAVHPR
jgi:hypothetical protein